MQTEYLYRCLLLIAIVTEFTTATLSKSDKSKSKKKDKEEKVKPTDKNVQQRGLVNYEVTYKEILKEHASYCEILKDIKVFETGDTLAYVTPWNGHGYDIAKMFGNKFTYVSPVWLQVKHKPGGAYSVTGEHDIDKGWVSGVTKGRSVKMVPRILFDSWTGKDYQNLFSSEDEMEDCINTILEFIKEKGFSGVVVEIWSQLGGYRRKELVHFLTHMGEMFKEQGRILILVIPPPLQAGNTPGMISKEDFDALVPVIDKFSLMTYDFSSPASMPKITEFIEQCKRGRMAQLQQSESLVADSANYSINTDDPIVLDNDLIDDYRFVSQMGLSNPQIIQGLRLKTIFIFIYNRCLVLH